MNSWQIDQKMSRKRLLTIQKGEQDHNGNMTTIRLIIPFSHLKKNNFSPSHTTIANTILSFFNEVLEEEVFHV